MIGEEHEEIPSDSDSQERNGYKEVQSYLGINGISHSEPSYSGNQKDTKLYSGAYGADAQLPS